MSIAINTNWIERPEDFYITADIEYYNDKIGEYWEDEDVEYNEVDAFISDRWTDDNLAVERIVYWVNDMLAGNDEKPELVSDYGETEYVIKALEMLKAAKKGR